MRGADTLTELDLSSNPAGTGAAAPRPARTAGGSSGEASDPWLQVSIVNIMFIISHQITRTRF